MIRSPALRGVAALFLTALLVVWLTDAAAVERSGGEAVRAQWGRDWQVDASTETSSGTVRMRVFYFGSRAGPAAATFFYDVATGAVTRSR